MRCQISGVPLSLIQGCAALVRCIVRVSDGRSFECSGRYMTANHGGAAGARVHKQSRKRMDDNVCELCAVKVLIVSGPQRSWNFPCDNDWCSNSIWDSMNILWRSGRICDKWTFLINYRIAHLHFFLPSFGTHSFSFQDELDYEDFHPLYCKTTGSYSSYVLWLSFHSYIYVHCLIFCIQSNCCQPTPRLSSTFLSKMRRRSQSSRKIVAYINSK